MKFYTGIGSRETPPEILEQMQAVAYRLAHQGFTLRSGRAKGADAAFQRGAYDYAKALDEEGVKVVSEKMKNIARIYVPWEKFCLENKLHPKWLRNVAIVEKNAPDFYAKAIDTLKTVMNQDHFNACSTGAKRLHVRNTFQILGDLLDKPSEVLLYWAPMNADGTPKGGTRTAVMLARLHKVPTINMAEPDWEKQLDFITGTF